MSQYLLEINSLSIDLPPGADRPRAVHDISLGVCPGETLCLVGESGSGKTVLAQAVLGMLSPALPITAGRIHFDNAPLPLAHSPEMAALRGAKMAMIFQEPTAALNPIQKVGVQVEEVFIAHKVLTAAERRGRVLELFDSVHLPYPERIFRSYPHQLSGGQCQRVVIAMALALNPKLLIADEPTTALDVTTQAEILKLIRELKERHEAAILFITHDFGVVADVADRIAVMRDGAVVEMGSRSEILFHPKHDYTKTLLMAVPDLVPPDQDRTDTGREAVGEKIVLEARNVTRIYTKRISLFKSKPFAAVDQVSLQLSRGRTLGIVGESGSGKSTLARCLLRLETVDGGQVMLKGQDITHIPPRDMRPVRRRLQVVLQDPYIALNPRQKIGDAIAEGPIIHGESPAQAQERARDLLELVGLPPMTAQRYPHEFSGGQRQRICIARALALNPEILIADEAVSALDVSIQAQILDLMAELQEKLSFALLFITHDLRVAASICDDILVMQHGRVVEFGPTDDLFRSPREDYTRALLEASPGKDIRFSNPEGPRA